MHLSDDIDFRCFADRESFAIQLLTSLSDVLGSAIGEEDAEGFIDLVAHRMGRDLSRELRSEGGGTSLDAQAVAEALVKLKSRIGGGFRIERVGPDRIELSNSRCPFGQHSRGRTPLCAMTSGVFGRIAADHLGFARVDLPETIARGDCGCRVIIRLDPALAETPTGLREKDYFAG